MCLLERIVVWTATVTSIAEVCFLMNMKSVLASGEAFDVVINFDLLITDLCERDGASNTWSLLASTATRLSF